jgi:hypothetical protein
MKTQRYGTRHPLQLSSWLMLLLVLTVAPARGQPETSAAASGITASKTAASLLIDGRLDDPAWTAADPATGFRQFQPDEGAPATQETEVRIVYGAASLYIGATLYDESPEEIVAALGRRDDINRADWFFVSIDSYFDRQTAYTFGVNAGGVQFDGIRSGSGEGGGPGGGRPDESWDAVWESDVAITAEGWVVEIRIPYSMLRFSEADAQRWGIHFSREIPRLSEESEWPLVPRVERSSMVARYATLDGITGIQPRRNVQVRPYTLSRLQTAEDGAASGELARETSLDVGADFKVGVTSGITLDATVNPDFGQVEVDPAVLNLTAFETRYDERRPFFVEGSQIFEFGLDRNADLLYTRRIGAQAPIIGAAKLSGRTAAGTSIGFLGATTGDDFGPERHYTIARVNQQIGAYSSAGGILTGFLAPEGEFRRRSLSGGGDWDLRFGDNTYGVSGFGVFSRRGTAENGVDETGYAGSIEAARREGVLTYDAGVTFFSSDFNPNDLGQIRRNNFIDMGGGVDYEIRGGQPFGPFQRADLGLFAGQEWSFDERLNTGFGFRLNSNWTLRSFQRIELSTGGENLFGGYDLFESRGMGPWEAPAEYELGLEMSTDDRRSWAIQPEAQLVFFDDGSRSATMGFRSDWNVSTRVGLSAQLEYEMDEGVTAWSANNDFLRHDGVWHVGDPGRPDGSMDPADFIALDGSPRFDDLFFPATFQSAAVFGARDTRAVDLTLRSNITFSPTLSLQFYGQLFLARGRYHDFSILTSPETLAAFEDYPMRNDFSFNSFTANSVLRWEYRPGSTLYLVWTQGRSADHALNPLAPWGNSPYETPLSDQFSDTFRVFPENVFLVKLNYTFLR